MGGNKKATLEIAKETADRLIKSGEIKIGSVKCRVTPRVDVKKCYKCLEFGHERIKCSSLKCGNQGHKASACTKTVQYCYSYKINRHSNGSSNDSAQLLDAC